MMPLKDDLHKFVDGHIREIQYTAYAIGALGVFLVVKDLHLASTFRHVWEIPQKFITSNVTLQGRVEEVSTLGKLQVRHQPIITLPFSSWIDRLCSADKDSGSLTVEVAGVEMTPPAIQWLSSEVTHQHVWFALLQSSDNAVICSVYKKKNWLYKQNINEALVKQGLAPVCTGFTPPMGPASQALVVRLQKAEALAKKKKLGVWERRERDPSGQVEHNVSMWRKTLCYLRGKWKGKT